MTRSPLFFPLSVRLKVSSHLQAEFSNLSRSCDRTNNFFQRLLYRFFPPLVRVSFLSPSFLVPPSFSFLSLSSVSSLWESLMDVYIVKTQADLRGQLYWDLVEYPKTSLSAAKSGPTVLHPLLYLSLFLPFFVCFVFFLPLTATQRGAISHSAPRGLEELKATEQKKNRKTEPGRRQGS